MSRDAGSGVPSEDQYRSFFDNSPIAIYRSTRDGRIVAANPAFAALLGYESTAEVLRLRMAEDVYWNPADRERLISTFEHSGSVSDVDLVWRTASGAPVEVRHYDFAVRDGEGRVVAYEGYVTDVSERKLSERALRESEDRYRDLVEKSRDLICTHDLAGRILSINPWAAHQLGYDRHEVIGRSLDEFLDEAVGGRFGDYLETIRRHGYARGLLRLRTRSGEQRIWEFNNTLRTEGVPEPLVRGVARDVTEREEARRLERALLRISESGHDAATIPELAASIHRIVASLLPAPNFFVALYDEKEGTIRFPYFVDEHDPPPPPGPVRGLTGRVIVSGQALRWSSENADPDDTHQRISLGTDSVDWIGVPLRAHGKIVGAVVVQSYTPDVRYTDRDLERLQTAANPIAAVIARKQAEEALRESEARYERVVANIGDALMMDDLEGRVVYANDRFLELFGLRREELDELRLEDYVAPEYRVELRDRHERRLRGEEMPSLFEYEGVRSDGTRLWLEARVSKVVEDDRLVGTQSAIRDVTERREADLTRRRLEEQLRQAVKMEAIGNLAGGVAHDFNNMLAVILGNVELALAETAPAEPIQEHLIQIRQAAERSVAITRQLLAFARKQTIRPRRLDLNDTVSRMMKMLGRLLGENLELVWRPGAGVGDVVMDPIQVDQMLANLAINARDAIDGEGKVVISTRRHRRDSDPPPTHGELKEGEYVVLEVRDTGQGMDRSILGHLFEPFFTTKGTGKGTGMGLATVYGIVEQNRGAIRVWSEPGRGALFALYLPRAGEDAHFDTPAEPLPVVIGRESILFVEDERAVLDLGRRILERAGFTVLAAATPEEALAIASEAERPFDLLVTDVMLPGISGRELSDRLVKRWPGLRCLYTSGYPEDVIAYRGVLDPGVHFLPKPFTPNALTAKVREILDA